MIIWKGELSMQHCVHWSQGYHPDAFHIHLQNAILFCRSILCACSEAVLPQRPGFDSRRPCGIYGEQEWHWDRFFSRCFGFCHHSHSTTAAYPSFIYLLLPFWDSEDMPHSLDCLVTDSKLISHSYHIVDGPRRTTCHFISTSNVCFLSGTNSGRPLLLSRTVKVVMCNDGYGISWWGWDSTVSLQPSTTSIVIPKQ